jgi:hypothetical protein
MNGQIVITLDLDETLVKEKMLNNTLTGNGCLTVRLSPINYN